MSGSAFIRFAFFAVLLALLSSSTATAKTKKRSLARNDSAKNAAKIQENSDASEPDVEANYQQFKEKWMIAPFMSAAGGGLDLTRGEDKKNHVSYYSAQSDRGFALSYENLEISFSASTAAVLKNALARTSSRKVAGNLDTNYFSRRFAVGLHLHRYHGISGTDDDDISWRQDLDVSNHQLYGIYIFSPESFSLKSAMSLSERQKNSGGSFLVATNATYLWAKSKDGLFPTEMMENTDSHNNVFSVKTTGLGFLGGYGYNFVFFKGGFLSLSALAGLIAQNTAIEETEWTKRIHGSDFTSRFLGSVGYNGDLYLYGMKFDTNYIPVEQSAYEVDFTATQTSIFLGRRF